MTDHQVTMRRINRVAHDFLEVVDERKEQGGVDFTGIPTGFFKVDQWTGGLSPDQLWLVGARSGVGKTSFCLNVALNVARQNKGVIVYSLEMSGESLVKRLLASMTGIAGGRIERGKITDDEMRQVRKASDELNDLKMGIVDTTLDTETLTDHALRTADRVPVDLVVIDYVALLRDKNAFGETQRVANISTALRTLARPDQLNAPVLLVSQLNRASEHREDHTPQLSDLRDSGQLEQDAHVVLFPFRPYLYEKMKGAPPLDREDDAKIIIAKSRDGPTGSTHAAFYPRDTRWEQSPPEPTEPKTLMVKSKEN